MTTAKHTPGPWRTNKDGDRVLGKEGPVCDVIECKAPVLNEPQSFHAERQKANARLIAAAPDLLAALRTLMAWVDENVDYVEADPLLRVARAAIAKALGKDTPL